MVIGLVFLVVGTSLKGMDSHRLPPPKEHGFLLEDALRKRRSLREFSGRGVSLQEISNLLYAAQGITDTEHGFRAAPSAGALYPLSLYLLWDDALWLYEPASHSIYRVSVNKDLKKKVYRACLFQSWVLEAPAVFIFTADYNITAKKYGKRAWRYIYLEVGHACENLLLEATALGMGGVPVGAFYDDELKNALTIPQTPIYVVPVGYPEGE